jgi:hypothetical protein
VSEQADSVDADAGADAAAVPGQARAGGGEDRGGGTGNNAHAVNWQVGEKQYFSLLESKNIFFPPRSRDPEVRHESVVYLGLDGERDLLDTFHTSFKVIQSVIDMVRKPRMQGIVKRTIHNNKQRTDIFRCE